MNSVLKSFRTGVAFFKPGVFAKRFFVSLKKVVDANASVSGATDTAMAISVNHPQDLIWAVCTFMEDDVA